MPSQYFYLVHFRDGAGNFYQLPVLAIAADVSEAKSHATALVDAISRRFTVVFEPSPPLRFLGDDNQQYIRGLLDPVVPGPGVQLSLSPPLQGKFAQPGLDPGGSWLRARVWKADPKAVVPEYAAL